MMWTALWVLWIVAFGVIEYEAVHNDAIGKAHGASLSSHIRRWFRVDTHYGRTAWLVASGVFFAWFVVHIAN
jgi:hypothetical protein